MRRLALALTFVVATGVVGHAQLVVFDPAVTVRNTLTAIYKELLLTLQTQQHSQLRRMAQRLSMFTNLAKYGLPNAPLWRIHDWTDPNAFLFSRAYNAALNYGDASGAAFDGVSQAVVPAATALAALPPGARRALAAQLATIDAAAASVVTATHDTGQLRFNGRRELSAIEALEHDVTDGTLEQSATAVLDKISGAVLIGGRQRQARAQLLAGLVEQLLVEGKRARDTEAATMNMQLLAWRDRAVLNTAFVAGTGDALRTWRQP